MLEQAIFPPLAAVYVQPGGLCVGAAPTAVTTVLGSCVAVCLFDPHRGLGGLNHYLLPYGDGGGPRGCRFGNVAIEELISTLCSHGSRQSDLVAKIFGGADVLDAFRHGDDSLGARNVDVARALLQVKRIPIVAHDVRGERGRKLIFHTHDGNAYIKRLGRGV